MSLALVYCRAQLGIAAPLVTVEAHIRRGQPGFSIVGLPETVVKESKDRVRSALLNAHFKFPSKKIIVNLAPADLPKEGGRFDLPIALSILAASDQINKTHLNHYEFAGELALSGELRPFKGGLPFALATQQQGRQLVVPPFNANEAALIPGLTILSATHLLDVCQFIEGTKELPSPIPFNPPESFYNVDMSDIQGQATARRALEIAAAGGHSVLMKGPPGSGKTMLAARLPTILPTLTINEALESAVISSLTRQGFQLSQWQQRPLRAPHHTVSAVGLMGGGNPPKPGEVSLAHKGVLFLDEMPEFNRSVLEVLREPLESRKVCISRAAHQVEYPAHFQLIGAMNPCPCGYSGHPNGKCYCTRDQILRYQHKLSGPLLDRIDIHVEVAAQEISYSPICASGETSAAIKKRVIKARERQYHFNDCLNSELPTQKISSVSKLTPAAEQLLHLAAKQALLSARTYHRVLKVSRTIADLDERRRIEEEHITEALMFRVRDRELY